MNIIPCEEFTGRQTIYSTVDEITRGNVIEVLNKAIPTHNFNERHIDYLFNYYKGIQPILERKKIYHNEICNKITENRANEIVSFKTSYLCGEPIQYVARNVENDLSVETSELNDMLLEQSKAAKDKELVEWGYICGTAYRFVLPKSKLPEDEISPFEFVTLDPRKTFVIYTADVWHRPLCGVIRSLNADGETVYTVYSEKGIFIVNTDNETVEQKEYTLGIVPIIEYPSNNVKMGAFESVLSLLESINKVDSNRLDGVEQFIQSLLILYNCDLPEGETSESIREKGLLVLTSSEGVPADVKQLVAQLDQNQTQTLKDDMYQTVLTIVGMPSQGNGQTSDSSNNGAVIMRNGWQNAEARAKDSELMFRPSESLFLQLILRICKRFKKLTKLKMSDIDFRFTRRCYEDIYTKAQVLVILLNTKQVDPQLCFETCGLFSDPQSAYLASKKYVEELSQGKQVTAEEITNDVLSGTANTNIENETDENIITD